MVKDNVTLRRVDTDVITISLRSSLLDKICFRNDIRDIEKSVANHIHFA